jgi:transposase|tara:strand:+ start:23428 stop:23781 length:354 start_codon:yes stop_codon:yes gene_type:complete
MNKPKRPNFKPEFRLEVAQLVLDKSYSIREAAEAINVGKSTVDKWVQQLKNERDGVSPNTSPMTAVVSRAGIQRKGYSIVQLVLAMLHGEFEFSIDSSINHVFSFKRFTEFRVIIKN